MEIPSGISEFAWNAARSALSDKFTNPIDVRKEDVNILAKNINDLMAYDYKFVTWGEFLLADKPDGLLERIGGYNYNYTSMDDFFVVFDPLDDADGFLLIAREAMEIAQEACEYISNQFPEEGPLSVDNDARSVVEAN